MRDELSTVVMLWVFCSNIGSRVSRLYGNTVPGWREPAHIVTLDISFSGSNPLKLGQTVNVTCVTHNHLDTATIELMQTTGRTQRRIKGDRSPLTRTWNITEADHGTHIYCGSSFTSTPGDAGSLDTYYAKSDRIPLEVEGVLVPASEPNPRERVYIRIRPIADAFSQYTRVQYVCDVENMQYPVVEMMHKKGNLEHQLYFGYQTGFRWMKQNVTTKDGGTQIYCQAHTHDSRFNAYAVMSELHNLTVTRN